MLKTCLWALVALIALFLAFQIVVRLVRKIYTFPIPAAMIRLIDNPLRRRFFSAGKTLDLVGISPGMQVLELGPGSGFFSLEAARRVGPTGKLYSVDIEPQAIAMLRQKIQNLTNVEARVGDAYELDFPDESLDLALLAAVLGEIPDPVRALREINRVLKADGVLSITEMLPDPDYPLRRTVIRWCREAGFELAEKIGNFFYYTLNFRKAKGELRNDPFRPGQTRTDGVEPSRALPRSGRHPPQRDRPSPGEGSGPPSRLLGYRRRL